MQPMSSAGSQNTKDSLPGTEEEWLSRLGPERYQICRAKGTEPAFHNRYWNSHESGQYLCAGCATPLFTSDAKFDSGTGWPSFYDAEKANIATTSDSSHGMTRTEVVCSKCGTHLGHLFDDGPTPTGQRYCINSASLDFQPKQ